MKNNVTAAILAGGQSVRMGQHKALLRLEGQPLINRMHQQLLGYVGQVLVAGLPEKGLYDEVDCPVVVDSIPDAGPLAGLLSAMQSCNTSVLLTVPCDGVELPEDFVSRLCKTMERESADIVYCRDDHREHFLYGVFSVGLADNLQNYLAGGHRKVIDWIKQHNYAVEDFSDIGFYFSNVNTPEDWEKLNE